MPQDRKHPPPPPKKKTITRADLRAHFRRDVLSVPDIKDGKPK